MVSIYGEISRQNRFCHGELRGKSDVGMKRPGIFKEAGPFLFSREVDTK